MKNFFLKSNLFYFFYKLLKIFKKFKKKIHFAEFGEDIFVRMFFKKYEKGNLCRCWSYHPIKGSLTFMIYIKKNGQV